MAENPDPIDIEVGARIRARRRALAVSQKQLAESVGLTFQQIQKYESGCNRVSASMLVHISEVLCISPIELLENSNKLPRNDGIIQAISLKGARELLEIYAAMPSDQLRRSILNVAKTLGDMAGRDNKKK